MGVYLRSAAFCAGLNLCTLDRKSQGSQEYQEHKEHKEHKEYKEHKEIGARTLNL